MRLPRLHEFELQAWKEPLQLQPPRLLDFAWSVAECLEHPHPPALRPCSPLLRPSWPILAPVSLLALPSLLAWPSLLTLRLLSLLTQVQEESLESQLAPQFPPPHLAL